MLRLWTLKYLSNVGNSLHYNHSNSYENGKHRHVDVFTFYSHIIDMHSHIIRLACTTDVCKLVAMCSIVFVLSVSASPCPCLVSWD